MEDVGEPNTYKETKLPHVNYLFDIWRAVVGWKSHLNSSLLWGVGFILKAVYTLLIHWPAEGFLAIPKA